MKKPCFACLAFAAILLGLGSCAHANRCAPEREAAIETYHNSRNSLTWWGVYEGTVPSASGYGIDVRITLNRDYTFELRYEYLGRDDGVFTAEGTFQWNDEGSGIRLEGRDGSPFRYPHFYQVGETFLRQLDTEGNPVTGKLGELYVLRKTVR